MQSLSSQFPPDRWPKDYLQGRRRTFALLLALTSLMFLGGMILLNLLIPERRFSETENRVLKSMPAFSWADLIEGKWTEDYSRYLADQFPLRDFWVGLKSDADRALGKNESNGVYLGEGGQLLEHFEQPSAAKLQEWLDEVNVLATSLPNVKTYVSLIPNGVEVLKDKLPAHAPVDDQRPLITAVQRGLVPDIQFIDLYEGLYDAQSEVPLDASDTASGALYYKTDHHWTTRGAYVGYRELTQAMGLIPHELEDYEVVEVSHRFYGALASKSGFRHLEPDRIELFHPRFPQTLKVTYHDDHLVTDSFYFPDNLEKKDQYTVFLNGNQSLITIETGVATGQNLMLVKDSFANSLIPFLADHFKTIHVIDLRYFSDDLATYAVEHGIHQILILYNVKSLE